MVSFKTIFTPIGKKGFAFGVFVLNMYTAPALLMVFVAFACILMLFTVFVEDYAGIISKPDKRGL